MDECDKLQIQQLVDQVNFEDILFFFKIKFREAVFLDSFTKADHYFPNLLDIEGKSNSIFIQIVVDSGYVDHQTILDMEKLVYLNVHIVEVQVIQCVMTSGP